MQLPEHSPWLHSDSQAALLRCAAQGRGPTCSQCGSWGGRYDSARFPCRARRLPCPGGLRVRRGRPPHFPDRPYAPARGRAGEGGTLWRHLPRAQCPIVTRMVHLFLPAGLNTKAGADARGGPRPAAGAGGRGCRGACWGAEPQPRAPGTGGAERGVGVGQGRAVSRRRKCRATVCSRALPASSRLGPIRLLHPGRPCTSC